MRGNAAQPTARTAVSGAVRGTLVAALILAAAPALDSLATPGLQGSFYRSLVERYRRQDQTSIVLLAGMPDDEVSSAVDALIPTGGPADEVRLAELRAAGILHTDAALRLLRQNRGPEALSHGLWAAKLIDAAARIAPPQSDFEQRWYTVTAGLFHAEGGQALGQELARRGRQRFDGSANPAGARATVRRGIELEIRAAGEGPVSPSSQRFGRYRGIDGMAIRWLDSAAREYEHALRSDATLAEAALHLGRVRVLQGRFDEATAVLTPLVSTPEPRLRYLALMFLGAVAERQDRFADAEARYVDAMRTFRWGQSSALALSQLVGRLGRESEARATLDEHLRQTRGRVVEPLWTYLVPPGEFLGLEFDQLRAEIWL